MKTIHNIIIELYQARATGATDKALESMMFDYLSQDEKILPSMMMILLAERRDKHLLLMETNSELSKALVALKTKDKGMIEEAITMIITHYKKFKDKIKCCFRIEGLED